MRRRGADGRREQHKSEVECPSQNKDYSETFHLIDKGNSAGAFFHMDGNTKQHN